MGLLGDLVVRAAAEARSLENPSTPLSAPDDWLYGALGAVRSSSGVNVNRETAFTYSCWWRGVNLISGDVAKLPLCVYRQGERGKERDGKHFAYPLVRRKANEYMSAHTFKKVLQAHALTQGNGYAYIYRDGAARPLELVPLMPDRTYPIRANGVLWYGSEVYTGNGAMEFRKLPAEDVLHIKGLGYDGLQGYSVIAKARESLGLGMAAEKYGSIFFRNGSKPNIALEIPLGMQEQAVKNIRESWERAHSGLDQAHRVALLREGVKLATYSINAKDAQLLETRAFQRVEVANWFSLPPHKLGDSSRTAYNSLEQENQAYLDECLDHWLVTWEEECWDKLLSEAQKSRESHYFQFSRRELLRANLAARGVYYVQAATTGWMSPDEIRAEEGMNPVPGGEGGKYYRPLQYATVAGDEPEGDGEDLAAARAAPGRELLPVPDVRQTTEYSCGAAATAAVCQYFGKGPQTEQEAMTLLGTSPTASTRPQAIIDVLLAAGLRVEAAHDLTLQDLITFWQQGRPVICCLQDYMTPGGPKSIDWAGHYVVVVGVAMGLVFAQDSSADNVTAGSGTDAYPGRVMIDAEDWLGLWHDRDVDGNAYVRFGIAVGDEVEPEPEEKPPAAEVPGGVPPGKPGAAPPVLDKPAGTGPAATTGPVPGATAIPNAGDEPGRAKLLAAHRRLLADVAGRMLRRLGVQARRASKRPREFVAWLDTLPEHRAVLAEAFGPAVDALAVLLGREESADALAGELLGEVRAWLLEVSGGCTAADLEARVGRDMAAAEALQVRFAALARFFDLAGGGPWPPPPDA